MENEQAAMDEVTKALTAAGVHVVPLTDTIANVHVGQPEDETNYLFTITVSVTP